MSQDEINSNPRYDAGTDDIAAARTHRDEVVVERAERSEPSRVETIYHSVEQMAQFPGGDSAMMKWIADNIRYPQAALDEGIQGRVTLQFVVEKDGSITSPRVVRSRDPELDREALRLVSTMPTFTPGIVDGKPVRSYFTLPVTFKLPAE